MVLGMRCPRICWIAALGLVAVPSACGSGHGNHPAARTSSAEPASQLARRLELASSDVPGFLPYYSQFSIANSLVPVGCIGLPFHPLAEVHSASYSAAASSSSTSVVSVVSVLPDAASAQRLFSAYRARRTLDCIKAGFQRAFTKTGIKARLSLSVLPSLGPGVFAIRGEVRRLSSARAVREFNDSLIFVRGPAAITLGAYSVGAPPPTVLERRVITALMDRAARAIP